MIHVTNVWETAIWIVIVAATTSVSIAPFWESTVSRRRVSLDAREQGLRDWIIVTIVALNKHLATERYVYTEMEYPIIVMMRLS